jgi:hypothetical protein
VEPPVAVPEPPLLALAPPRGDAPPTDELPPAEEDAPPVADPLRPPSLVELLHATRNVIEPITVR